MSALEWSPTDIGYAGAAAPRRPHLVVLPGGAGQASLAGPVRITRRGEHLHVESLFETDVPYLHGAAPVPRFTL